MTKPHNLYRVNVKHEAGATEVEVVSAFGRKGAAQRARKLLVDHWGHDPRELTVLEVDDLGPWTPPCEGGACPIQKLAEKVAATTAREENDGHSNRTP